MAQSPNAPDDNLALESPAGGGLGLSRDKDVEETDADIEIVEEGETAGPVPAAVWGQPDLTPITYWIGCSRVMEGELDKYVERGILKSSLRGLCHDLGRE